MSHYANILYIIILNFLLDLDKVKCTCTSRDRGVVHLVHAAALAIKGGPLCHQPWNNEAKSRPIDMPRVATSLPSATERTTLGQESVIIFGRANIDLSGEHSLAEPQALHVHLEGAHDF